MGTGQSIPSTLDSHGRPITLGWNVDINSSGGNYGGAYGQGTVTIAYTPSGHSKNSAGGANIVFNGLVMPSGVTDITQYDIPKFN